MLLCMNDNFHSLADRAVRGMASWRYEGGTKITEDDENEQGPVYLGELETMLASLVKFNENDDVIKEAKALQARLAEHLSQ